MTNEQIVAKYASGASLHSIASEDGRARSTIKRILTSAGVPIRGSRDQLLVSVDFDSIISLYNSGKSLAEVARITGYSLHTVRKTVRGSGIDVRTDNYQKIDIDQQELERLYYIEKKSTYELATHFGCSDEALRKRLPRRRWYDEVNRLRGDEVKLKISKSCSDKWLEEDYVAKVVAGTGTADYKSKLSEASARNWKDPAYIDRWRRSYENALEHGDARANISAASRKTWQKPEYRAKLLAKLRPIWASAEFKTKQAFINAERRRLRIPSRLQQQLYQYLDDIGATYFPEGPETVVGFWTFDCRIPTNRRDILIECQGLWFHSKPEQERRDRQKFTYINRYFGDLYEIMYIWEDEFCSKERVLDRLKLKLGMSIDTADFEFRDVSISPCPAKDYRSFLDAYHYIGKGRGGKCIGAYLGDRLIACCAFSPPLRQNMQKHGRFVELSRFCIHPSYHKKNFASWFISKCLKHTNCSVVAYSDTTIGHDGTMYKAANFKLSHTVPSDYWYVDKDGYVMHKLTLYKKAKQFGMTESKFAAEHGYAKKYGGEKLCYVYNK